MKEAYRLTRKDGAPGIDGVMADDYASSLEANLLDLLVALHVNLDKMPEPNRGDFHRLGCLFKSLLVDGFAIRPGRSYSPCTLSSNFIRLTTMPGRWRHVAQCRM